MPAEHRTAPPPEREPHQPNPVAANANNLSLSLEAPPDAENKLNGADAILQAVGRAIAELESHVTTAVGTILAVQLLLGLNLNAKPVVPAD